MNPILTLIISMMLLSACSGQKKSTGDTAGKSKGTEVSLPSPKCIVYKTKKDYNLLVPVILGNSGSAIVSYPDISDIRTKEGYPVPTPLEGGYLLDNRGIGPGVAFLSYTYESYGALPHTPEAKELLLKIIDKDPLLEMYDCGYKNKYSDIVKELNNMIICDELKHFKRLK